MRSTEELIARYTDKFRARRGHRFIHAAGRGMDVRTPGERILHLPNGATVKVTTDDSGHATHVEESDGLHGIARPDTLRVRLSLSDIKGDR